MEYLDLWVTQEVIIPLNKIKDHRKMTPPKKKCEV